MIPRLISCLPILTAVCLAAEPAATVTQNEKAFTLSNGYLTAQVDAVTGDLTSLQIKGIELMGYGSGHHAGYWEQSPARAARLEAKMHNRPEFEWRRARRSVGQGLCGRQAAAGNDLRSRNPLRHRARGQRHLHVCDLLASGGIRRDADRRKPFRRETQREGLRLAFDRRQTQHAHADRRRLGSRIGAQHEGSAPPHHRAFRRPRRT